MPGPMGGGRGGGFSGGSRGGGSFGGGSRGPIHHGPMHHGPHHHHHGPIFFFGPRRRHYGGGGGCLGGVMFAMIFLIIFAIFIVALIAGDSGVGYDERTFETFANEQYYAAFSNTDDYEGNILLVFLVYEGYDGYDCIPWGGYNIDAQTEELFGSYFESTVRNAIPDYYEFALTKSLRQIVNKMTSAAPGKATAEATDTQYSELHNHTALEIDKEIVNTALQEFTAKTGYPIAIVVEDGVEVFGDEDDGDSSDLGIAFIVIIAVIIIVFVIAFIVSKNKNGGGNGENGNSKTTDKNNPDAGQGKYDPNTGEWK